MIRMSEHPLSELYVNHVKHSWRDYDLFYHEATTVKDLVYRNQLKFGLKQGTVARKDREFSATEKAVWYSHFDLWCKCLREWRPMIIIEHDSKLIKPIEQDILFEGYKILSYIRREDGTKDLSVGSGYYITPLFAERLISNAICKTIKMNSDGHIANFMNTKKQKEMNDFYFIEQVNIEGLNTIEHYTPKRHFIGLDYEDIDLPSVHGK